MLKAYAHSRLWEQQLVMCLFFIYLGLISENGAEKIGCKFLAFLLLFLAYSSTFI